MGEGGEGEETLWGERGEWRDSERKKRNAGLVRTEGKEEEEGGRKGEKSGNIFVKNNSSKLLLYLYLFVFVFLGFFLNL